jgi:hypothetical protein
MSVWVNMTNSASVAVFNAVGTNTIPAAVNPTCFVLPYLSYVTNAAGGGYYSGMSP